MTSAATRVILSILVVIFVFLATAGILLKVLSGPRREIDFLVIGAAATMVSLLVLFVLLISTWAKSPDTFFKRRKSDRSSS
ncbi:MAG: hypothetical protein IT160_20160 [Bryobacterales bacterium]|nr:hypothetical protein [Bryobacterales bacterium]